MSKKKLHLRSKSSKIVKSGNPTPLKIKIEENSAAALAPVNELQDPRQMVLLEPMGMAMGPDQVRPLLLMKMKDRSDILPVLLSPLEAGLSLALQSTQSPMGSGDYFGQMAISNPHRTSEVLFSKLGVHLIKAEFWEIKGPLQFIKIYFETPSSGVTGEKVTDTIMVRADEAMSLGLYLKVPFFATLEFIQKSRALNAEVTKVSESLIHRPELLQKSHPYLI